MGQDNGRQTCPRCGYVANFRTSRDVYMVCRSCRQQERNDTAKQEALERARQRARDEDDRIRERQAELEKQERERQKRREEERRWKRQKEKDEAEEKMKKEQIEREKLQAKREEMLRKKTEEIEKEAKKLEELKSKSQNPFLHFKQLHTLQTVKEISKEVNEIAVVGKIVTERVNQISNELEETLGDDYQLVQSAVNRYKNYGQEMQSMTDTFKREFESTFKTISNVSKGYSNIQVDLNELQKEINEADDEDEKDLLQNEMRPLDSKLNALNKAIKNVEAKLFLMEQYYDQMSIDYKYFKAFISAKEDELEDVAFSFQKLAELLDNVERSVLEGTGDQQQLEFVEEYESKETTVVITRNEKNSNAIQAGAVTGAMGGGIAGGIPGAVAGCIIGGVVGALCPLFKSSSRYKTETKKGIVSIKSELITYQGRDQANALKDIAKNVKNCASYQKLRDGLKADKNMAAKQLRDCDRRKQDIVKIGENIRKYKLEMKQFQVKFKNGNNMSDDQAKLIDKKLNRLCAEIEIVVQTMK
eukprot:237693_1